MGILFLTVKQEKCSDLLLWSAAWLLPPPRLMPMLMLTTATATALATEDSATLDSAMVDTDTPVLAMEDTVTPVLAMLTARGRLRPSPRLMPSTDTELTPTLLATVTPPPPLPPLPSATPVSDTLASDTLVSDTLVSDTPVLATVLVSAMLVLDTPTARGRPRLSPRLMLTTATDTLVSDTPVLATLLVSATLPPTATATVWEPTELDTELTTD